MSGPVAFQPARHGGNPLLKAIGLLSAACGVIAALLIVISVGVTCQMIYVRYVLNASTVWQTEAVVYMMVAATILGLPYVQRVRGHVSVDLLPMLLPRSLRRALAVIVLLASLSVIGLMVFYGFDLWNTAFQRGWRSDTVWGPPLWIPYLALPLGFALYGLQLIADLIAVITGIDAPFGIEEEGLGAAPDASESAAAAARERAE